MIKILTGTWTELGAQAQALRHEVFVGEQGVPAELEWDEWDPICPHALALNPQGEALGTGRLLQPETHLAKIGRMAVKKSARAQGIGRQVLQALEAIARQRGDHRIVLHAQTSAVPFYLRLGYLAQGPVFEEAGILHQEMIKHLEKTP